MSSIRSKNTKPEILIRKNLWRSGVRYSLHAKDVFGKPDICFRKRKIAIFVDGCFWHGCKSCYKEPKTNITFWRTKIEKNRNRRIIVKHKLQTNGWKVLEFWEHETKINPILIQNKILAELQS